VQKDDSQKKESREKINEENSSNKKELQDPEKKFVGFTDGSSGEEEVKKQKTRKQKHQSPSTP